VIQLMAESRVGVGMSSRFLHRDPILVCGAPRTGTSWTAKVLSLGGNIRYMREPLSHGGYAAASGLDGVPYLTADDVDPKYEELWRKVLSMDPLMGRRWLVAHSRSWLQRAPFWPARLLVKEVNCPLALDWLSSRFDMTMLITIRHPCGYVASGLRLKEVGHEVVELDQLLSQPRLMSLFSQAEHDRFTDLVDPVARMAAAYGIIYKLVGDQLADHPEWTLVRHETLCRDPRGAFRRLCKAVGLGYNRRIDHYLTSCTATHDDGLYSLQRVSSAEPDKWKTELTNDQIDTVASVIAPFRLPFYRDFA
jgi:hypothetical protein